ncbi:MAG: metallophosphoesterase [Candidatus Staskawiczbacteria bacterium]|nr:metallophosphoesterase [Candidatus Staskawiczbacteria bacterium]
MKLNNNLKITAGIFCLFFVVVFIALSVRHYTVVPANEIQAGDWNHKQIAKIQQSQSDKFRFAVLSDSHVNPENGGNSATLRKILQKVDENNYSFAIDVGDLEVGSANNSPPFFYNLIKNEKTPFLVDVGNHDLTRDEGKYYLNTFGNFYYSFSNGNSLFIVANDANGAVGAEQMLWLGQQLKKNYSHKFVFMHIPFYDPRQGTHHDLDALSNNSPEVQKLSSLMEKYKPNVVFFGHIHAYYNWVKNGVRYIITGGAGGSAVGIDPKHDFHNYIEVQVDGDNVTTKVIKIP